MTAGKVLCPPRMAVWRLCPLVLLVTAAVCAADVRGNAQASQPSATAGTAPLLLPMPREYSPRAVVNLAHGASISADADVDDQFAAHDLAAWLQRLDVPRPRGHAAVNIRLLRANSRQAAGLFHAAGVSIGPQMRDEGYVIVPSPRGLAVIADTPAGLFYGTQTLKQMVTGSGAAATLQTAVVRDWPAMRYRGLSDDLSRGPVPTLQFQERQIQTLAAYKVNVYSPYFENTLQYRSNPLAGLPGGSMSREDVRALVNYAHRYHITIIPEQEAFGHLHHVLTYEQYAPLAETPMGSVLAPGQPGSLDLIGQWFNEIVAMFPGPFLHVGADETFDLGRGRTKSAVDAQGLGKVYIDFLTRIHARLAPLHRRLLFWGDIAMNDPADVKQLPKDMIAVAWEYSPRPEGYKRWLQPYVDAGMETWVAPGVNDWYRVYPDYDLALHNIQGFVSDGQAEHSTGMLNTVWNDDGEGLFLNDWYGVLFGAAAGWQQGSSNIEQFQAVYGQVFHGDTTGNIDQAQREMIAAYHMLDEAKVKERTDELFWEDPWSAEGQETAVQMRPLSPALRLHVERAITLVAQARAAGPLRETDALDALELGARRLDFIGQKFETADEIARIYNQAYSWQYDPEKSQGVSRMLWNISGVDGFCEDMREAYSASRSGYSDLWLRENRPYWLQNVLVRYDLAIQLWAQRGNHFLSARTQWNEHHTLPSPAELGVPATLVN
ncbi:MAG: glycoside hydrolase family 20 zincin-like fold domain-containing protein [Acidobacteriaceae bacterium]